jgi:peptidoglycan hydrolase CwlO-like protein
MTKSTIILPSERYERYEKKIAEKDAIIEKITSERDAHLREKDAYLAEKDAHLAEKDALIAELRAQIAEMKKNM